MYQGPIFKWFLDGKNNLSTFFYTRKCYYIYIAFRQPRFYNYIRISILLDTEYVFILYIAINELWDFIHDPTLGKTLISGHSKKNIDFPPDSRKSVRKVISNKKMFS